MELFTFILFTSYDLTSNNSDTNELTGTIPEEWGEMRELEELFLTRNELRWENLCLSEAPHFHLTDTSQNSPQPQWCCQGGAARDVSWYEVSPDSSCGPKWFVWTYPYRHGNNVEAWICLVSKTSSNAVLIEHCNAGFTHDWHIIILKPRRKQI